MKILRSLAYLAFIIGPLGVWGQYKHPSDTLLDHMTGKWLLKGTIAGANIEHDITAAWVLGHQYMELKETSRGKQADGTPSYDAIVFITLDNTRNQYDCLWLDNTSNKGLSNGIIAHAEVTANKIPLLFKLNNNSYFHTTLSYSASTDTWHWQMYSDDNGKTETFADATMTKAP